MKKYPENPEERIEEALNILDLTIRLQIGVRENFIIDKCFIEKMAINRDSCSILNSPSEENRQPIF